MKFADNIDSTSKLGQMGTHQDINIKDSINFHGAVHVNSVDDKELSTSQHRHDYELECLSHYLGKSLIAEKKVSPTNMNMGRTPITDNFKNKDLKESSRTQEKKLRRMSSSIDIETSPYLKKITSELPGLVPKMIVEQEETSKLPAKRSGEMEEFVLAVDEQMDNSEVIKHNLLDLQKENYSSIERVDAPVHTGPDRFTYEVPNLMAGSFLNYNENKQNTSVATDVHQLGAYDISLNDHPTKNMNSSESEETKYIRPRKSTAEAQKAARMQSTQLQGIGQQPDDDPVDDVTAKLMLHENENEKKILTSRIQMLNQRISKLKKAVGSKAGPTETSLIKQKEEKTESHPPINFLAELDSPELHSSTSQHHFSKFRPQSLKEGEDHNSDNHHPQLLKSIQVPNLEKNQFKISTIKPLEKSEILRSSLPTNYLDYVDEHIKRFDKLRSMGKSFKDSSVKASPPNKISQSKASNSPTKPTEPSATDPKASPKGGEVASPIKVKSKLVESKRISVWVKDSSTRPSMMTLRLAGDSPIKTTSSRAQPRALSRQSTISNSRNPSTSIRVSKSTNPQPRLSTLTFTDDNEDVPQALNSPSRLSIVQRKAFPFKATKPSRQSTTLETASRKLLLSVRDPAIGHRWSLLQK